MDLDDGIRIFAESLYRSRGEAAEDYAKGYAAELARCGDWDGREVWTKVADAIRLLARHGKDRTVAQPRAPASRAATGRHRSP
jgi:hypothetical protein